MCLDTYGQREGGVVSLYTCHGQAGNQVDTPLTSSLNVYFPKLGLWVYRYRRTSV